MSFKDIKLPTSEELKALREEILEEIEAARKACVDDNKNLTFDNGFLCGVMSATLETISKFAEPVLDINNHDGLVEATAAVIRHTEKVHHAAHELIGDPIECPGLTLLHEKLNYAVAQRQAAEAARAAQVIKEFINSLRPKPTPMDPQKIN